MKREQAEELAKQGIEELELSLKQGKSETLLNYLNVMSRFHRYSFNNSLMIYFQATNATKVAGYNAWKKLGRTVKKGEKGIGIFAPIVYKKKEDEPQSEALSERKKVVRGYKVVHVFDISQTEGKELPEFAQATGGSPELLEKVEQLIESNGIELTYEEIESGAEGVSFGGKIAIETRLALPEKISVAIHELAHELLHKGDRRSETSKTVRETEAEAVAFVVCNALGVDTKTKSSDYIQLYQGTVETLSESLQFIQKTSEKIIEDLTSKAEVIEGVAV
jgi:antirestriction protein ArdC